MNSGARRPPAVTGSITIDNSGMPTMENPPPNEPFMKQIRKTPAKATRIVAAVNSMGASPYPGRVGLRDEAVDRGFYLAAREADVAQFASVELARVLECGPAGEIARNIVRPG